MTDRRQLALEKARAFFDTGLFIEELSRRVACPSTSQSAEGELAILTYFTDIILPELGALGFDCEIRENEDAPGKPLLFAQRIEDPRLPTILNYGHADTVLGMEGAWREGLNPWALTEDGSRLYGRGTADNKGQHCINLAALSCVLEVRKGKLGFNLKILLESAEEIGSAGLRGFAEKHKDLLKADLLIASDGPRVGAEHATLYMGSRGAMNFSLTAHLREGAHHSGNWGGVLPNAGVRLAHALTRLVGSKGEVLVPALKNPPLPNALRADLAKLPVGQDNRGPDIDPDWGTRGLSPAERLYGHNTLEILAFSCGGDVENAVNAIPGTAKAICQLRFTTDTQWQDIVPAVQAHLKAEGFEDVVVEPEKVVPMPATRLDSDHATVRWARRSLEKTLGHIPLILPNLGGTIPNDVFANIIGMPTIWVPHSYAGCNQHAPNEHMLKEIAREGLEIMAGLWWDMGEAPLRIALQSGK